MTQAASATHVVVIPSYDTGPTVYQTVRAARAVWQPVYVVVDGSRDGTGEGLQAMAASDPGLRVWLLPHNQGKGALLAAWLAASACRRLQPRADDGCRRPARPCVHR
jgi:glycosyltransferase involved in cell wall biosynthesis